MEVCFAVSDMEVRGPIILRRFPGELHYINMMHTAPRLFFLEGKLKEGEHKCQVQCLWVPPQTPKSGLHLDDSARPPYYRHKAYSLRNPYQIPQSSLFQNGHLASVVSVGFMVKNSKDFLKMKTLFLGNF